TPTARASSAATTRSSRERRPRPSLSSTESSSRVRTGRPTRTRSGATLALSQATSRRWTVGSPSRQEISRSRASTPTASTTSRASSKAPHSRARVQPSTCSTASGRGSCDALLNTPSPVPERVTPPPVPRRRQQGGVMSRAASLLRLIALPVLIPVAARLDILVRASLDGVTATYFTPHDLAPVGDLVWYVSTNLDDAHRQPRAEHHHSHLHSGLPHLR